MTFYWLCFRNWILYIWFVENYRCTNTWNIIIVRIEHTGCAVLFFISQIKNSKALFQSFYCKSNFSAAYKLILYDLSHFITWRVAFNNLHHFASQLSVKSFSFQRKPIRWSLLIVKFSESFTKSLSENSYIPNCKDKCLVLICQRSVSTTTNYAICASNNLPAAVFAPIFQLEFLLLAMSRILPQNITIGYSKPVMPFLKMIWILHHN